MKVLVNPLFKTFRPYPNNMEKVVQSLPCQFIDLFYLT